MTSSWFMTCCERQVGFALFGSSDKSRDLESAPAKQKYSLLLWYENKTNNNNSNIKKDKTDLVQLNYCFNLYNRQQLVNTLNKWTWNKAVNCSYNNLILTKDTRTADATCPMRKTASDVDEQEITGCSLFSMCEWIIVKPLILKKPDLNWVV